MVVILKRVITVKLVFLSYLTILSTARLYNVKSQDDGLMIKWKRFGRKRSWSNCGDILASAWRDWGKPQ
jgi:hypothetical protein